MNKNLLLALIAAAMVILSGLMIAAGLSFRARSAEIELPPNSAEVVESTAVPTRIPSVHPAPTQEPTADAALSPAASAQPTPQPSEVSAAAETLIPSTVPGTIGTPSPLPTQEANLGEAHATVAEPTYLADGRWAEVMVTVRNVSVPTGIATGYTYLNENPDGGTPYVTGFSADHQEVPQAVLVDGAPLWRGHVQWDDGRQWWFPAGCLYVETVDASGWEPIGGEGFHWEVHWTGGFFDCGNSTHKIPQQPLLMPGQEATIPLYVYLQHPRLWTDPNWGPPGRTLMYIGVEVFDGLGRSLGVIGELDWR